MAKIKYSIVIPAVDNYKHTKECVDSIRKHSANYEIILIDNGSRKKTQERYPELQGYDITICIYETLLGFPKAVNEGLKRAKGVFLVILNNDTIVSPDWLNIMSNACLKHNALIGIAGGDMGFNDKEGWHKDYIWQDNKRLPRKVDYCAMSCLMMHRIIFKDTGYLDEGFGFGYSEDADYGLRAMDVGWKNVVIRLDLFHKGQITMRGLFGDAWVKEQTRKGWEYLALKRKLRRFKQLYFKGVDRVSVSILSWNTLDDTAKCVESIIREKRLLNTAGVKVKLIVIDNGSDDGSQEYLKQIEQIDELILNKKNLGISIGRNQGIAERDGKYLFMVDSDITIVKGSFVAMLRYMETTPKIANLGAHSWQVTPEYKKQTQEILELKHFDDGWWSNPDLPKRFTPAMTQYGIFRTKVFKKCKFDTTDLFGRSGWGYEDCDFGLQMAMKGFKIRAFTDIVYYHKIMSAVRNFEKRKQDNKLLQRLRYVKKKWNIK